jgi:hypothetical protein
VYERRLTEIQVRRERLLARAASQRDEFALLLAPWRGPLQIADRGLEAAQYVRAHPSLVAIAAVVLLVLSPRRALRWTKRAYVAWRGYRWAVRALGSFAR